MSRTEEIMAIVATRDRAFTGPADVEALRAYELSIRAALSTLEAELDVAVKELQHSTSLLTSLCAQLAEAKLERARVNLRRYGCHYAECCTQGTGDISDGECDCGLRTAIASAAPPKSAPEAPKGGGS